MMCFSCHKNRRHVANVWTATLKRQSIVAFNVTVADKNGELAIQQVMRDTYQSERISQASNCHSLLLHLRLPIAYSIVNSTDLLLFTYHTSITTHQRWIVAQHIHAIEAYVFTNKCLTTRVENSSSLFNNYFYQNKNRL